MSRSPTLMPMQFFVCFDRPCAPLSSTALTFEASAGATSNSRPLLDDLEKKARLLVHTQPSPSPRPTCPFLGAVLVTF